MSQERQYLDTLFQPSFRALGRRLLPMEVGHWLLLSKMGKLCLPGQNCGGGDLALAVYVASRPSWKAARRVQTAGPLFLLSLLFLTRHGAARTRELANWRAYVLWNLEKPVFRDRSESKGKAFQALHQPFWMAYLRRAKASGMTEREALAQRIKTVFWESVGEQEDLGAVVWCSEEEIGIQKAVMAQMNQPKEESKEEPAHA